MLLARLRQVVVRGCHEWGPWWHENVLGGHEFFSRGDFHKTGSVRASGPVYDLFWRLVGWHGWQGWAFISRHCWGLVLPEYGLGGRRHSSSLSGSKVCRRLSCEDGGFTWVW